ncbi:hypothetical protein [Zophobihabitans entericus]|nr:hypothetical protein [Zophobihabitans entericus]
MACFFGAIVSIGFGVGCATLAQLKFVGDVADSVGLMAYRTP